MASKPGCTANELVRRFAATAWRRRRGGPDVSARSTRPGRKRPGGHRWSQAPVTWGARPGGQRDHTVHLSYVRDKTGHALIGARSGSPASTSTTGEVLLMGLPLDWGSAPRTAGHRHLHGRVRRRHRLRLRLRRRGLRQLHPAARVLRDPRPGVRAARAIKLHPHPGRRHQNDLRAAVKALLKDKRRWEIRSAGHGSKASAGTPGLDRHRQPAPPPAGPPHLKTGTWPSTTAVPGTQVLTAG